MPRFTEHDLIKAGLTVVGNEAVKIDKPDSSWDITKLLAYAKGEMAEALTLAKRTTVHYYRAGHACSILRDRFIPPRTWSDWQKQNGLPRTTVNRAIRIYEGAGSEEACVGLPIMEAFEKFGIIKRKKTASADCQNPGGEEPNKRTETPPNGASGQTDVPLAEQASDEDGLLRKVGQLVVVLSAVRADVDWASEDLDAWQTTLTDLAAEVEALREEMVHASV